MTVEFKPGDKVRATDGKNKGKTGVIFGDCKMCGKTPEEVYICWDDKSYDYDDHDFELVNNLELVEPEFKPGDRVVLLRNFGGYNKGETGTIYSGVEKFAHLLGSNEVCIRWDNESYTGDDNYNFVLKKHITKLPEPEVVVGLPFDDEHELDSVGVTYEILFQNDTWLILIDTENPEGDFPLLIYDKYNAEVVRSTENIWEEIACLLAAELWRQK